MPKREELAKQLAKLAGVASWCYRWELPDRTVIMVDDPGLAEHLKAAGFEEVVTYECGSKLLVLQKER
jgi:hypothetical protein